MYHISKDKRAVKSAELIVQGLEKCLETKNLKEIRIVDINEASYVSRATFYRLFDCVEDVLIYDCDLIFEGVAERMQHCHFNDGNELFLFFIKSWFSHKALMNALAQNHLTGILYDVHMRHRDLVETLFIKNTGLSQKEAGYLISILTGMIPSVIEMWNQYGQTDTPEDILNIAKKSISVISDGFISH